MLRQTLARSCSAALALALISVPPAFAAGGTGGAAAAGRPQVRQVACGSTEGAACAPGEILKLKGNGLDAAEVVVFMGGRTRTDDRRAKPRTRRFSTLTVRIPAGARSGPVQVAAHEIGRSRPTPPVQVVAKSAAAPTPFAAEPGAGVFPVGGAHEYGTGTNRFGGGRGHKGQDVFATCGTPVVAAVSGKVTTAKWQDAAGNFAVITADDGTSQAYMHMRRPALVKQGARVVAGQQVGEVGETGRATGCHLHFEFWTAPGWYKGGEPVDPLPFLRRLDTAR